MKRLITAIAFLTAVLLYGKVILIPDDFTTIQDGIDNSADIDTVLVKPGTYYERINFSGKNITLASLFLTTRDTSYTSQTIIDGGAVGSVVTFAKNETENSKLIGFTIKNGYSQFGAGIHILGSSPFIADNIITKNRAKHTYDFEIMTLGSGSGIYLNNSSSTITRNRIIRNYGAVSGGGLLITDCENTTLINNIISYNSTENFWACSTVGGGVHVTNSTNIMIDKCLFVENTVCFDDIASQIYSYNSSVLINRSTFYNFGKNDNSSIFYLTSQVNITNCIIWYSDNFLGQVFFNSSYPVISYSDIKNWNGGTNNFSNDPLFENYFDFSLKLQSPCINSGDSNSEIDPDGTITDMGWASFDMKGFGTISGTVSLDEGPRTINNVLIKAGNEVSSPLSSGLYKINLPAGNYTVSAQLTPKTHEDQNDIDIIEGLNTTGINFFLPNDSANYSINVEKDGNGDFVNINEAVTAAITGDSIIVADGIYNESISLIGKSLILASLYLFDNDSTHIYNTIIDGEDQKQQIFIDSAETKTKIAGLTFTNGKSDFGGSCYARSSAVEFSNCKFIKNRAENSGGAIYSLMSNIDIKDCMFIENISSVGGAICNIDSYMSINKTELKNNTASGICGAIYSYGSYLNLLNSVISFNKADEYGGVWSRYPKGDYYVNNKIIGNSARFGGGLSFEDFGYDFWYDGIVSFVYNNLIADNSSTVYGGGVYFANSFAAFINNTVVNNVCDGKGGGINVYSATDKVCWPLIYNNIIWCNSAAEGDQIAVGGSGSSPVLQNCDIQGGKPNIHYFLGAAGIPDSNYVSNIDIYPVFFAESDYRIYNGSPCIDKGTVQLPDSVTIPSIDLNGYSRIYGSTIDIGAYEWQGVGIENNSLPEVSRLHQNYPNPFNPQTEISYSLKSEGQVVLSVFNTKGELVSSLVNEIKKAGNHSVNFNGEGLNSGIYFYRLSVNNKVVASKKMMMLK